MIRRFNQILLALKWRHEVRMLVSSQLDVLERNSLFALGGLTTEEEDFLVELLRERTSKGPIIEFGTLFGITSRLLAENAAGSSVLSVDNFSWNPFGLSTNLHRDFTARILRGSGVELIEENSKTFRERYAGTPPSFVFLDADHSYEVVRDEIAWAKSVGAEIICGHDYANPAFGVTRAVDELFPEGVRTRGSVWCGSLFRG